MRWALVIVGLSLMSSVSLAYDVNQWIHVVKNPDSDDVFDRADFYAMVVGGFNDPNEIQIKVLTHYNVVSDIVEKLTLDPDVHIYPSINCKLVEQKLPKSKKVDSFSKLASFCNDDSVYGSKAFGKIIAAFEDGHAIIRGRDTYGFTEDGLYILELKKYRKMASRFEGMKSGDTVMNKKSNRMFRILGFKTNKKEPRAFLEDLQHGKIYEAKIDNIKAVN